MTDGVSASPDPSWFVHDRFGMFVHWGLYSLGARHEWLKNRERLSDEQYLKYFTHFAPDRYAPQDWARSAREAGMKYVVLTAKHHDGFCLWDTALTDYKITNTPFGADAVGLFVDAARTEGLKVGLYYSLLDWHHPDFPVDGVHPQRDDEEFKAREAGRDIARYREYLHGQVEELLTTYGPVDLLFFDFSYEGLYWGGKGAADWGSQELLGMVRRLSPGTLVNDRLGIPGDYVTPEQYQPLKPMELDGKPVVWEACQTLNGSWGYDRDNQDFKSAETVVKMLVDGVSKNGNLILNVGPTGRGDIEPQAREILRSVGTWMADHQRSIRGAGPSAFEAPTGTRLTQRGNRLYLHLFDWPYLHVHLPGLAGLVDYAQLMLDASEIAILENDPDRTAHNTQMGGLPAGTLTLELPVQRPDTLVPVVELFLTA
ncbi:alpha-L-fucosidase [Pseudarthrobacter sp. J47]